MDKFLNYISVLKSKSFCYLQIFYILSLVSEELIWIIDLLKDSCDLMIDFKGMSTRLGLFNI